MVKVPRLDLSLPPASPRHRTSTPAGDDMYSFMPHTPAPATPQACAASTPRSLRQSPTPLSPVLETPHTASSSAALPAAKSRTYSEVSATEAGLSSSRAGNPTPKLDSSPEVAGHASEIGPGLAEVASGNQQQAAAIVRQSASHGPAAMLLRPIDRVPETIGPHANSKPWRSSMSRASGMAAQDVGAGAELDQMYPRSWNGTPRAPELLAGDQASLMSMGPDIALATRSDAQACTVPDALIDGQYRPQQLLARNEVRICASSCNELLDALLS